MPITRLFPATPEASSPWALRFLAALFHLVLSVVVAAFTALLVFWLWYPTPFRDISGGRDLFLLVIAVDVVIGPLLTAVAFDLRKSRGALIKDLGVIVLVQLAALSYGTNTVALARPAVIALEGDRLRVVRAIDLAEADWTKVPPEQVVHLLSGPRIVATRAPSDAERNDTLSRGLAGEDIGMRPEFWLPASTTGATYAKAAKPLTGLTRLHPDRLPMLEHAVAGTGRDPKQLGYLPILARSTDWSALVDLSTGAIAGYVPIDGF
jgi:hypothetical protein